MDRVIDDNLGPKEVSTRILSEHALLRPILKETQFLARSVARGDKDGLLALRAFALMLYEKFITHIELEDRILAPAVRQIIGWGPALHADMVQEHRRQREHLRSDITALKASSIPKEDLAASVDGFVAALMQDMEEEERRLLRTDLLDDSPLCDGESG
jgi:hemerythrin-like domain-containing protein